MTTGLFDQLHDGSASAAWAALDFLGARKESVDGTVTDYCFYNLGPMLEEVRDYLIPYMQDFANASDQGWAKEEISIGVDQLLDKIQRLGPDSGWLTEVCPDLADRKLMQGYLGDYPLYCLIPYLPSEAIDVEKFRQYKSVVLLCGLELRRQAAEKEKDYRAALKSAADALRLITNSPLLKYLPEIDDMSLADVHEGLGTLAPGERFAATKAELGYVRALTTLLKFVVDKTGGTPRKKREVQADIDSSENDSGVLIRTTRVTEYSDGDIRAAKKSGLAVAELASDLELITENPTRDNGEDDDEQTGQQIRTLARQAISRQRQLEGIERGAQLLPNSVNRLTTGETAAFLSLIQQVANTSNCGSMQIESASALLTSFWLSKTLQESLQLVIYAGHSNLPKSIPVGFIGYLQESHEWVIPSIKPKGAPKHKGIDLTAAIPVQRFIRLADIVGAHQYFSKLKAWERAKLSKEGVSAFEAAGASIETVCNQILKTVKKQTHGRVTMSRIRDTIFLLTLDQCQDKALAIMTLARPHRLGDTQLHYTTVSVCMLQKIYIDTCRKIVECMILENSLLVFHQHILTLVAVQYSPSDLFVGCAIRPRESSICRVVNELTIALKMMRSTLTDLQSRVDFANLYTAFTIFFLWHVTGVRAVNQSIPSKKNIDSGNKLLLASDKDDYTSFNTRLVPMVRVLVEQLDYYFSFQKDFEQRYRLTLSKVDKTFNKEVDSDKLFFYFYELTGERMKQVTTTPTFVMAQIRNVSPWFGLPENSHRSRLRSVLLERSCPPQWIDALLGHWTRGEEPWHRFASTSLSRVIEGLRGHLEEIAHQDGWTALKGIV